MMGHTRWFSEREAKGELERTRGIERAWIEVVPILEPNRADESSPSQTATNGKKGLIEGIIIHVLRYA